MLPFQGYMDESYDRRFQQHRKINQTFLKYKKIVMQMKHTQRYIVREYSVDGYSSNLILDPAYCCCCQYLHLHYQSAKMFLLNIDSCEGYHIRFGNRCTKGRTEMMIAFVIHCPTQCPEDDNRPATVSIAILVPNRQGK